MISYLPALIFPILLIFIDKFFWFLFSNFCFQNCFYSWLFIFFYIVVFFVDPSLINLSFLYSSIFSFCLYLSIIALFPFTMPKDSSFSTMFFYDLSFYIVILSAFSILLWQTFHNTFHRNFYLLWYFFHFASVFILFIIHICFFVLSSINFSFFLFRLFLWSSIVFSIAMSRQKITLDLFH